MFQWKMQPEKIWLDQIQNGRLLAIVYFPMPDICELC